MRMSFAVFGASLKLSVSPMSHKQSHSLILSGDSGFYCFAVALNGVPSSLLKFLVLEAIKLQTIINNF